MIYSVRLNYAFRTGTLTGVIGNRSIYLLAPPTMGHVFAWEKQQEIRSGGWTFSDHTFVPPGGSEARGRVLLLSTASGRSARPSSTSSCDAPMPLRRFFVDDGAGGCFIHGWPPCRSARCIVLPHGIEELVSPAGSVGILTIIS